MAAIGAALRLAAAAGVTLAVLPVHWLWPSRRPPSAPSRAVMAMAGRLLRLRWRTQGFSADGPMLVVANHVSWADIFVLSACIDGAFAAKEEVRGWPVLGWLAARQGTLFLNRGRRMAAGVQRDAVAERLRAGGSVILFAEGTSSDGSGVLPFKSALFAAAVAAQVRVQPVTILWEMVGDAPVDETNRRQVAWIDDMTLPPHLWRLVTGGGARARVVFHSVVSPAQFDNRAALARYCRDVVAGPIGQAALRNRSA